MFTGLVQCLGTVAELAPEGSGAGIRLRIHAPGWDTAGPDPLVLGESVAVNGCCLTLVAVDVAVGPDGPILDFQAGPETLARTNLGRLRVSHRVNLERALRVGDRLGGHFVQGHVDTTATVQAIRPEGEWHYLAFGIDPVWTPLLVPKGSIAVDGISLTLVTVAPDGFSVMLIPHTLEVTTLGRASPGDLVNIETDLLAKHLRKLTQGA